MASFWEQDQPISSGWEGDPVVDEAMSDYLYERGVDPGTTGIVPPVPLSPALEKKKVLGEMFPEGMAEESDITFMDRVSYENSRRNPKEVEAKFYQDYPQGEIQTIPIEGVGNIFAIKTDKAKEKYALINPLGFDKGDFGGLVANAPEIGGSILAAILTKGKSAKLQILADYLGPQVGLYGKEVWEAMRGVQKDPLSDVLTRGQLEGVLDVTGGRIAATGVGISNVLKDVTVKEGAREVAEATGRLGLDLPSTSYLTESPPLKKWAAQARASARDLTMRDREVQAGLFERGKEIVGEGAPVAGRELRENVIPRSLAIQERQALDNLPAIDDAANWNVAGKGFREGTQKMIEQTTVKRDELYGKAYEFLDFHNLNKPGFDVTEGVDAAKSILRGIPAKEMVEGEVREFTIEGADSALRGLARDIARMQGVTQDFNTLKRVRTKLYDLASASKVSGHTEVEAQAMDLYQSLTRSMDRPMGMFAGLIGPKSKPIKDQWERLWKRASKYNRLRDQRINETDILKQAVKNQKPSQWARTLATPDNYDDLMVLRKTVSPGQWEQFRDAWKRDLLFTANNKGYKGGDSIGNQLDEWKRTNPKALRMMLSANEERTFRMVGTELERIKNTKIATVLDSQFEAGKVAFNMIDNIGPDEMRHIISSIGGRGSRGHKLLKDALADYILVSNVKRNPKEGGRLMFDANGLAATLDKFRTDMKVRGVLAELYDERELRRIMDIERVADVYRIPVADTGASLEVAQDISSLKNITRGDVIGTIRGAHGLWFNRLMGKFFLSPGFEKYLVGKTGPKKPLSSNAAARATVNALIQSRKGLEQLASEGIPELNAFISRFGEQGDQETLEVYGP
jgi:hypothetical protein